MLTPAQIKNRKVIEELALNDVTVAAHHHMLKAYGVDYEAMLISLVVALVKNRKELLEMAIAEKQNETRIGIITK